MALKVPYFGAILGSVGGLTDALLAFVIPPLVFFRLKTSARAVVGKVEALLYGSIMMGGLLLMTHTAMSLLRAYREEVWGIEAI